VEAGTVAGVVLVGHGKGHRRGKEKRKIPKVASPAERKKNTGSVNSHDRSNLRLLREEGERTIINSSTLKKNRIEAW